MNMTLSWLLFALKFHKMSLNLLKPINIVFANLHDSIDATQLLKQLHTTSKDKSTSDWLCLQHTDQGSFSSCNENVFGHD